MKIFIQCCLWNWLLAPSCSSVTLLPHVSHSCVSDKSETRPSHYMPAFAKPSMTDTQFKQPHCSIPSEVFSMRDALYWLLLYYLCPVVKVFMINTVTSWAIWVYVFCFVFLLKEFGRKLNKLNPLTVMIISKTWPSSPYSYVFQIFSLTFEFETFGQMTCKVYAKYWLSIVCS